MSTARAAIRPWSPPDVADALAPAWRPRPPARPAEPPPPPPLTPSPAFAEADIARAREQGLREGAQIAEQAASARAARAMEDVASSLQAAAAGAGELAQRTAVALAEVLLQSLAAAFPSLESRLGPAQAALLIRAVLPGLLREPAIAVHVAPATATALGPELDRLKESGGARLTVQQDPTLGAADIRIVWRDGEARRDGAAMRQAVLEALDALVDIDENRREPS